MAFTLGLGGHALPHFLAPVLRHLLLVLGEALLLLAIPLLLGF